MPTSNGTPDESLKNHVVDMNDLPWDPSDRPRILHYNPNQKDEIRRTYWLRGPCQPLGHDFPKTIIGNKPRRFIEAWFAKYRNWNIDYLESFEFVFYMHFMLHILGVTDILSRALQRKDQDILEAVKLVTSTKEKLKAFRREGFGALLEKVHSFCEKHDIPILKMEENYVKLKSKRQRANITNQHYYEFDCFNTVLDMQIQEFGDRFNEVNTELLRNMAALCPCDSFSKFDASKLMRLSEMYPCDFDDVEKVTLEHQLDMYYHNVRNDDDFANLNGIADLSKMVVEKRKHLSYPLVYRLLKLTLVLPVATATVERCFSLMKLVKTDLRNRIGDDFLSACVICAVEKEIFANVSIEDVIQRFQKMNKRRVQL